ncbi:collagen alpha-1(I) chain-like [Panthera pardus]|uniref:Collagen alpha-1(I) chain-like n=1 Tax=Panthera pardus TaxID=9691 RepID=A0A9W2VGQ0_PANPR|nr:collagen alpha-1(I) chain-like [Panthera pardus]
MDGFGDPGTAGPAVCPTDVSGSRVEGWGLQGGLAPAARFPTDRPLTSQQQEPAGSGPGEGERAPSPGGQGPPSLACVGRVKETSGPQRGGLGPGGGPPETFLRTAAFLLETIQVSVGPGEHWLQMGGQRPGRVPGEAGDPGPFVTSEAGGGRQGSGQRCLGEQGRDQGCPGAPAETRDAQGSPAETRGVQGPPAETRGVQGPPAETRGVQGPPAETRDAQGPPAETRGVQGPPAETRDTQGPPAETRGVQGAPAETRDAQGPPAETRGVQGPPAETRDAQGPPAETRGVQGTPEKTRDAQGPYAETRDPQGPGMKGAPGGLLKTCCPEHHTSMQDVGRDATRAPGPDLRGLNNPPVLGEPRGGCRRSHRVSGLESKRRRGQEGPLDGCELAARKRRVVSRDPWDGSDPGPPDQSGQRLRALTSCSHRARWCGWKPQSMRPRAAGLLPPPSEPAASAKCRSGCCSVFVQNGLEGGARAAEPQQHDFQLSDPGSDHPPGTVTPPRSWFPPRWRLSSPRPAGRLRVGGLGKSVPQCRLSSRTAGVTTVPAQSSRHEAPQLTASPAPGEVPPSGPFPARWPPTPPALFLSVAPDVAPSRPAGAAASRAQNAGLRQGLQPRLGNQ